MKTRVRPLLSIGVQHPFYAEPCADFEFATPASTAELLRSGRLLAHVAAGRLQVLFDADGAGAPICNLTGKALLFGLRLVNPFFENVTTPVVSERGQIPLYRNGANPRALDAPVGVVLTSGIHTHEAKSADRPLTVRLVDRAGNVLQTEALEAGNAEVRFDLRALPDGDYTIEEFAQNAKVASVPLSAHSELRAGGVWGLVAVSIAADFYANRVDFTIPFAVREEPLKYFVVCRNYKDADLDQLSIADEGFAEEARPQITFARIAADPTDPADIRPSLPADPSQPVVMFRSAGPLKRRERGFRKLRLSRNGQTLVENLPAPGPDRARAYCIVHVAKPS